MSSCKDMLDVRNEDALSYVKSLRDNSVDLVLTDPPYAISRDTVEDLEFYVLDILTQPHFIFSKEDLNL